MNLTRNSVKIAIVILGIILGSVAKSTISIVPTSVDYSTNEDVKVLIAKDGDTPSTTSVSVTGKSMLPIHRGESAFYYSPTLSLNDLTTDNVKDNYIYQSYDFKINKAYDNMVLEAKLDLSGDDALNKAVRVMFQYSGVNYVLSSENPDVVLENAYLSKDTKITVRSWTWYELEDVSVTIENINNASGTDITLSFYANAVENE